jgi:c(7)-type cytochrome triheme protein
MNNKIIVLPVLLISLAVGVVVYRGPSSAEENNVMTGAQSVYQDPGAAGENYGAGGAKSTIPKDILYTRTVKSVVFSHQTHAADLEYKCNVCHSGLFQMKAKTVESQPDFNMKGLSEGKYCGSCHSSKNNVAFSSDTQCARCHVGVKGLEKEEERNS